MMRRPAVKNPALHANKRRLGISGYALALFGISLVWVLSIAACAKPAYLAQLPPILPPNYYQCVDSTAQAVEGAYFDPYGHRWMAEVQYNDQPFVFKNIEIVEGMMQSKGPDYIWVDRTQCMAANPADIAKIKVGQVIDVVGIMRGVSKDPDKQMDLLMTDCYFLPAGSVTLPLPGGAVFSSGY
jgi:hypothetical protein